MEMGVEAERTEGPKVVDRKAREEKKMVKKAQKKEKAESEGGE